MENTHTQNLNNKQDDYLQLFMFQVKTKTKQTSYDTLLQINIIFSGK